METKERKAAAPAVKIEGCALSDNHYSNYGNTYDTASLIQAAKEQECIEFDVPLASVNLTSKPWEAENIDLFLYHAKRMKDTDLSKPIIFDWNGVIADGWHRICKAILEGKTTIKAVRLKDEARISGKSED